MAALLGLGFSEAEAGTGHFYTPEIVSGARANVKNFKWAADEVAEMKDYAKPWLEMSYDEVWNFLSEQSIPRAVFVSKPPRCPIHGSLESHGIYAYKTAPEVRWKVQCPIGGELWPTNDFEAYYKSGKNGRNKFDPSRANRGLLYSKDSSRSYGVDNGQGYVDSSGRRYHFAAYYAFWGIWNRVTRSDNNAISILSHLYLITGNAEYGRRAALLLARIADLYPEMNTGYWSGKGVPANDGGSNMGQVLGNIWDDEVANNVMLAYDALGDFIDTDTQTHKLLGQYSKRYGLAPQSTGAQIRAHVEKSFLPAVATAVKERRIRSNEGRAQYTMGLASLLAGGAALEDGLEWLNQPGDVFKGGGHLPDLFWNLVDRDGAGREASPYYNGVWMEALMPLAHIINLTNPVKNVLKIYPHVGKLLLYPGRLVTGQLFPKISDAGATARPELPIPDLVQKYVDAFLKFGDEEAAMMAYRLNGETSENLHGGLFDGDAKTISAKIEDVVAKKGRRWERSDNMNAYGLAQHRAGQQRNLRTMWLYWGRTGHGGNHPHFDRLNLGLFAFGVDILPDLGYPEYPTVWPTTQGWIKNTASHNTVVVDAGRQAESFTGDQRIFADTPYVQFSEVDGGDVYPQASLYRRSVAMIQIDDERSYVVDLFRVRGGNEHVYSFHAGEGAAVASGLDLQPQSGTYAGSSVKKGQFYDQPLSSKYTGSGFQFLDNVAADAAPPESFSVDWHLKDRFGALPKESRDKLHVRMTMIGNEGSVALADGQPAQNNGANPRSLRYMLVRNVGTAIESRFLGVIEPYLANPAVKKVEMLPVEGVSDKNVIALKITLATGRTDYVFSALDEKTYKTQDGRFIFSGPYGVYAETGGDMAFAFLADEGEITVDGEIVVSATAPYGKVAAVEHDADSVATVTLDGLVPDDGSFVNNWIDFRPDSGLDANFKVTAIDNSGGCSKLTLGDADAFIGFRSPSDFSSGLQPIVDTGTAYRFPAVAYERGSAYEKLYGEFEAVSDAPAPPRGASSDSGGGCSSGASPSLLAALLIPALMMLRRRRRG